MMKYYSGLIDEGAWRTASGDLAVFNTKYARNLKSLIVQLESIQAGSGDPSPDNVRPISGRTGATVTRTGKNLYHYDANNVSTCTMNNNVTRGVYFTGIRGGTYTFSAIQNGNDTTTTYINISGYKNGIATVKNSFLIPDSITQRTFTFDSDEYVVFTSASELTTSISLNLPKYNIQIEPGTTATEYEPYTGTAYPVSWETEAGTVYGAELDVVSGELTVDRKAVNINDITSWYINNNALVSQNVSDAYDIGTSSGQIQNAAICSMLPNIGAAIISAMPDISMAQWSRTFRLKDSACETIEAYMSKYGNGQICYYLAEPITYQLTPQQIQTLIGDNVIWSDAGLVSVEYWS